MGRLTSLKVGEKRTLTVEGKNGTRRVTFKRVKKTGSLQFRIVSNKKKK